MSRLWCVVFCFLAGPALALTQPSGAPIPSQPGCANGQPTGLEAVFACQCTSGSGCNIGASCPGGSQSCDDGKHGVCETTLWHSINDNSCIPSNLSGLDPSADASLTPETFHPTCALTFTVLSRGTARFQDTFGWYNVTGQKPDSSDLHEMLGCSSSSGTSVVLDVHNHPDYKGGDIGFFLVTPESHSQATSCAGGDCCAKVSRLAAGEGYVYYSERALNPDNQGAASFIHLLTYDSKLTLRKFYFAWEDIFGGSNDDFTDMVTSVQGVDCTGGGETCDTGQKGVCGQGESTCLDGVLTCQSVTAASQEVCDGYDNDCDGVIDNGATCPAGQQCQNGMCRSPCSDVGEFDRCPSGWICDAQTGVCHDPACNGVVCGDGSICRNGACVGPCDGIVCPHGETCRMGECLDPCRNLQCATGQVCVEGLCTAGCTQCGGLTCTGGSSCDATSGACIDSSCASPCPAGTYCDAGTCKDSCDGAKCPNGYSCLQGDCVSQTDGVGDMGAMDAQSNPTTSQPGSPSHISSGCGCDAKGGNASRAIGDGLLILLVLATRVRSRKKESP